MLEYSHIFKKVRSENGKRSLQIDRKNRKIFTGT